MSSPTSAGNLTYRFELTLNRILHGGSPEFSSDFVLADAVPRHQRRFTEFSGDVSGRYIEALSVIMRETTQSIPSLDAIVKEAIRLQKPDGHWGDPLTTSGAIRNSDMALLWGNGRMLVGLMANYKLNKRPEVLDAAKRLGDCLVKLAPRLNDDKVQAEFSDTRVAVGYICWTQVVEGLVELARVTGSRDYLKLAEELAARTQLYPSQHSHGFITSLRGILDLHRLTTNPEHLARVEKEWQAIVDSGNVLTQGALPEAFKPAVHRDEGCAESDWLRLNLDLWDITRNARYIRQAELTLFNEFCFNQFSSGDFGHHVLTKTGTAPPAARAWWCCTLHGLRAFPDIFRSAFGHDGDMLSYDIPVDGVGKTAGLHIRAQSRLEHQSSVELEIIEASETSQTFCIRVPEWADRVTVQHAEKSVAESSGGNALRISGNWKVHDRLIVRYTMKTRLVQVADKRVSVFLGPWLLAVDDHHSPQFFDEPNGTNRLLSESADDIATTASAGESNPHPLAVTVAHCLMRYAPGGYPMQPQSTVLRPISEKTLSPDQSSWYFHFNPASKPQVR